MPAWVVFTGFAFAVVVCLIKGTWMVIAGLVVAKRAARVSNVSQEFDAGASQIKRGLLMCGICIVVPVLLAIGFSLLGTALK